MADKAIRRQVRMSELTAQRLEFVAERMGMTKQQTLTVIVAQSLASAARGIELVETKTGDVLGTLIQENLDAGAKMAADENLTAADREHDET